MATKALGPQRRLRIDSQSRWFPDMRSFVRARQLLMVLARRDITVKYRQTVLGTIWIFGGPLVSAGLFTFVFGRVANLSSNGVPYFAFSYAGLLGWNLFSNFLTSSSQALTNNSSMIGKIYFPRLVLPLSTGGSVLINTAISFIVMLVLLFIYRLGISVQILLLPAWLLLAVMLAIGIGLAVGAIAVTYRDVNYVVPMFTQLLLYLSPVAYGLDAVPQELRKIYLLNPFTTIVEGCRWSLLQHADLTGWAIVYTVVLSIVILTIGLVVFARLESSFADVI